MAGVAMMTTDARCGMVVDRGQALLASLGLQAMGTAARRADILSDIRFSETPGLSLFSARTERDLTLEHTGGTTLAFVAQGAEAATTQAWLVVPNGRRSGFQWRWGDVITGVAFDMATLRRRGKVSDRPLVGGLHDLAASGGEARVAALARLLTFFTTETLFGCSLLNVPAGLDYLETMLFSLLAEGGARVATQEEDAAPAPRHLRRAEAYIRENLACDLSVEELARAARVSERSLYRAFNDFRGMTIRAYVQNARMEAARLCLATRPDTPLSEVARQVGYADYTSFWRHYRSRFGDSPSAAVRSQTLMVA